MILIRTSGEIVRDEPVFSRPVPKEVIERLRAQIEADRPLIEEMTRKAMQDAALLGPAPVGGEDEYFKSLNR